MTSIRTEPKELTLEASDKLMEMINFIWDVVYLEGAYRKNKIKIEPWMVEVLWKLELVLDRLLTLVTMTRTLSEENEFKRIVDLIQEVKALRKPDSEGVVPLEQLEEAAKKLNKKVGEWMKIKEGKRKLDIVLDDEEKNNLLNKIRTSEADTPQEYLGELLLDYKKRAKASSSRPKTQTPQLAESINTPELAVKLLTQFQKNHMGRFKKASGITEMIAVFENKNMDNRQIKAAIKEILAKRKSQSKSKLGSRNLNIEEFYNLFDEEINKNPNKSPHTIAIELISNEKILQQQAQMKLNLLEILKEFNVIDKQLHDKVRDTMSLQGFSSLLQQLNTRTHKTFFQMPLLEQRIISYVTYYIAHPGSDEKLRCLLNHNLFFRNMPETDGVKQIKKVFDNSNGSMTDINTKLSKLNIDKNKDPLAFKLKKYFMNTSLKSQKEFRDGLKRHKVHELNDILKMSGLR